MKASVQQLAAYPFFSGITFHVIKQGIRRILLLSVFRIIIWGNMDQSVRGKKYDY